MAQYQIDNVASPINFQGSDIIKRTLQNAKNLLMCRMGEVPYDRCRGFNQALYELPIEQMKLELMPELDRLFIWEPDVEAVEADASLLPNGNVYIKAIIEISINDERGTDG